MKKTDAAGQPTGIYLSVIIPAYNEAARLPKTLRRLQEYFSSRSFSYEIIVVSDGPRDNTTEIAKSMVGEIRNLRVINRTRNRGKGYTVREGMLAARGRVRLFMDADNGTDIAHLDSMLPLFENGYEVVISSRNPKDVPGGEEQNQPFWRRLSGDMGNRMIQLLAVPGVWDTQNGFKAFRDYAAETIFGLTRVDGWAFDVEVLALVREKNIRMAIVPAHWINDTHGSITPLTYFSSFWEVIKIRWNLISGKYRT